jgi:hypothetical protein
MQALSGCCEVLYGFDANDRRDAGGFDHWPSANRIKEGAKHNRSEHVTNRKRQEVPTGVIGRNSVKVGYVEGALG